MPKELQPTTILEGTIGIPRIMVIMEPASAVIERTGSITVNALQQAGEGRLPGPVLAQLQEKQADQFRRMKIQLSEQVDS